MDEQLRKRIEDAARKEVPDILRINGNYVESFITGFCFGGEWMFQECGGMTVLHDMRRLILAQCKEWLEYKLYGREFDAMWRVEDFLTDFEADMNKLWED